jgi:mannose-1-phosphate guanylyltransferase
VEDGGRQMRAMILAAGLGTRLRPLTYLMPKPVAPVLNRPIVARIAELLRQHGFEDVVTNVSYLPEQIREVLGDGSEFGLRITYSEEPEPLGTAGGVGKVRDFLSETESFLTISGDALTDIDLGAMRDAHEANVTAGAIATLATKRVDDTTQFGVAITDAEGRIQGFQEKPDPAEALSDLANCGIYMFRREIFDHFPPPDHKSPAGDDDQPPGFVDWALDVFPALLDADIPFHSHEIDAYWNDIGSVGEFVQGNFDALAGKVGIALPGDEVSPGIYAGDASDLDAVKVKPPVLIGAGCEIGAGVDLHGPVVIGDDCKVGPGAMIREAVILPHTHLGEGTVVVGGLSATHADRPLG